MFPPMLALVAAALLTAGHLPRAAAAPAQDAEKVVDSTAYLLSQCTTIQRDGRHNRLLLALRHLRDPRLRPFFAHLASRDHPILRIHGMLGLAEVRQPEPRLTLGQLAELEDGAVQVQLISAALDDELLPLDDARELLDWPELDAGVKLLVALRLVEHDQLQDKGMTMLREALAARRLSRRGLAALMLHQLGDTTGTEALQAISEGDDAQRDAVRLMLVRSALRHKLHETGTWAYAVTTEPEVGWQLKLESLQLALRYGDPRAVELWSKRFAAAEGPADRNRLALLALETAPWLEPALFERMRQQAERDLMRQAATVGEAITNDQSDISDQVGKLVKMNHPMFSGWALRFAREHAKSQDALYILLELVLAYQVGPEEGQTQRLDHAIQATQALYEEAPTVAVKLLRPILTKEKTETQTARAILLGLVKTQEPGPHRVLENVPEFEDRRSEHLALLLRAKHGAELSAPQMRTLGLLARGGGDLPSAWRIQIAWAWAKRNNRIDDVLQRAVE